LLEGGLEEMEKSMTPMNLMNCESSQDPAFRGSRASVMMQVEISDSATRADLHGAGTQLMSSDQEKPHPVKR
jgi:hypothetical protein